MGCHNYDHSIFNIKVGLNSLKDFTLNMILTMPPALVISILCLLKATAQSLQY